MRQKPDARRVRGLGLASGGLLVASLLSAFPGLAQPGDERHPPLTAASDRWDGYSELLRLLRRELGAKGVVPLATLDFDILRPGDALVITHPEVELDQESLTRFLAEGGRVLLLDDFGTGASLLERFHIRRETTTIAEPRRYLAQNPALAVAQPVVHATEEGTWSRHPTTEGIREIVTNHAVALAHPDLTALLEVETTSGPKTVATTGVIEGKGRLVAIGDSSLFINLMLRYPGNRAFLGQLARYLVEREAGAQKGKLYLVSGAFVQRGSFGQLSAREELARRLSALKSELTRLQGEGLSAPMARILAAFCALGILAFELRQGRPEGRVRLPSFAGGAGVEDEKLKGRGRKRGGVEQQGVQVFAELKEALELALAERLDRRRPLGSQDIADALATLPEERRRSGARVVQDLRVGTDEPGERHARRFSEGELSRLLNETTALIQDLRPAARTAHSDSLQL